MEESFVLKWLGCDFGVSIWGKGKDVLLVDKNFGILNYFGKFMSVWVGECGSEVIVFRGWRMRVRGI